MFEILVGTIWVAVRQSTYIKWTLTKRRTS